MAWPLMIEQVFRPRRQLLITFVEISTVVAEGAWASRPITNGPDGSAPYIAVCASPCLPLSAFTLDLRKKLVLR
jgi:hypothetical protein